MATIESGGGIASAHRADVATRTPSFVDEEQKRINKEADVPLLTSESLSVLEKLIEMHSFGDQLDWQITLRKKEEDDKVKSEEPLLFRVVLQSTSDMDEGRIRVRDATPLDEAIQSLLLLSLKTNRTFCDKVCGAKRDRPAALQGDENLGQFCSTVTKRQSNVLRIHESVGRGKSTFLGCVRNWPDGVHKYCGTVWVDVQLEGFVVDLARSGWILPKLRFHAFHQIDPLPLWFVHPPAPAEVASESKVSQSSRVSPSPPSPSATVAISDSVFAAAVTVLLIFFLLSVSFFSDRVVISKNTPPEDGKGLIGHYYSYHVPELPEEQQEWKLENWCSEGRSKWTRHVSRVDPILNWTSSENGFAPVIVALNGSQPDSWQDVGPGREWYTAHWTGSIRAPVSGQYLFSVEADDGFSFSLPNRGDSGLGLSRLEQAEPGSKQVDHRFTVYLTGKFNEFVEIWYIQRSGSSGFQVKWQIPGSSSFTPVDQWWHSEYHKKERTGSCERMLASSPKTLQTPVETEQDRLAKALVTLESKLAFMQRQSSEMLTEIGRLNTLSIAHTARTAETQTALTYQEERMRAADARLVELQNNCKMVLTLAEQAMNRSSPSWHFDIDLPSRKPNLDPYWLPRSLAFTTLIVPVFFAMGVMWRYVRGGTRSGGV